MTSTTPTTLSRLSDLQLFVYAVIALIIIGVVVALFGSGPGAPALSIRSTDPDGAMALRLWLEGSGFTVKEMLDNPVSLNQENAFLVLNPLEHYSSAEALIVRDWVRKGRTLIVAGEPDATSDLLAAFNVSLLPLYVNTPSVAESSPVLLAPPVDNARAEPIFAISTTRRDVVFHAYSGTTPVLASFNEGRGTVWVSGVLRPFSNRGLHDSNNARLILNMLSRVDHQGVLTFDEARHGFGVTRSLQAWLFTTPPGWSILITLVLTMTFLALRGRRFGRAVPLPNERLRREPVEYIQAMANLFRRSGQRTEMLNHYRGQLRRRLSERYAIDPRLSDVEFVKTIAFRDPTLDEGELRRLFARLSRQSISEAELLSTASAVEVWLRKLA
ncbi:MAG: DUF4350 domain-containing protein [Chloroflexota bacterium]